MSLALLTVFYKNILEPTEKYRFHSLLLVFLFYLFFGSYIHVLLNSHVEFEERIKITEYITDFYEEHSCIDQQKAREFLDYLLNASSINGIVLGQKGHTNTSSYPPSWSFGGETIFFTFTLLSTIGYGYLAPSTDLGKMFCVLYILIGVPLTFLVLYNLAERFEYLITGRQHPQVLKTTARDGYVSHAFYADQRRKRHKYYLKCVITGFFLITFIYIVPSIVFSHVMEYPSWSFLDAFYFCYISISTVGFGDFIPGRGLTAFARDNYRLAMTVYLFVGMIFNAVFFNMLMGLPITRMISDSLSNKPMHAYRHLVEESFTDDNLLNINQESEQSSVASQKTHEDHLDRNDHMDICTRVFSRDMSPRADNKTKIV